MNENLSILNATASRVTISKPEESSSIFGDWSCGEPLTAQHLLMDFTPSEEIDNDFVQRKCCALWDLVYKSPELRELLVMPELVQYNSKPERPSSQSLESDCSTSSSGQISCERTALSVLEFVEENGVVNDTFVPRLPTTCSLGPREYLENQSTATTVASALSLRNKACKCDGACKSCKKRQPKGSIPASSPEVKHLCKTMRDWDSDHPKSMDPPGHEPYLSHSIMRRNVIT